MAGLRVIEGGGASGTDLGVATYIWLNRKAHLCSANKVISIAKSPNGDIVPLINRWKMVDEVEGGEKHTSESWRDRHEGRIKTGTFILTPCNYAPDPLRPQPSFLVLCEARNLKDIPDPWNARARLRKLVEGKDFMPGEEPEETPVSLLKTWWGIQQHFHSMVGVETAIKVEVREKFLVACVDAGIRLHSTTNNHYWLGPRNISEEIDAGDPGPLVIADHTLLARFIYQRLLVEHGIPLSDTHMPCSIYLSTEDSRTTPDHTRDLSKALQGLKRDDPSRLYIPVQNPMEEAYRGTISRIRPGIAWEAELSEGLAVNTQALNYVRVTGAPGNLDPYEAIYRILEVLMAAQEKPSENPDPTEG